MANVVFWHLGLPKTGTTYLQTIAWAHRDALRDAGLLLPGFGRRQHLWASGVVREEPHLSRRHPEAPQAWERLLDELAPYDGNALISHEFFCSASAEQAARGVADLERVGAEVHLVLTAREPLGLFTSSWQESLKNKSTTPLAEYGRSVSSNPAVVWDWRALDLGLVLRRWEQSVDPERIHVVTMPGSEHPRSELWDRLCSVLDIDPALAELSESFPNESMGVVEAETLRRVNERLTGFDRAVDKGVWIRSFLADDRLVPRGGERFWPDDDQIEDARARGLAAVELIGSRGYDVVGDLAEIVVPTQLPARRGPSSVTDAEVAEVAVDLVARLLADVRDATREPVASPASGPDVLHRLWASAQRRLTTRR